ncbi:hypothetical protein COO60DRAFT_10869 [Scenedesmus sp. NREL 46B-D3]|nr:hypothetical protein COO60DRAFT_10869 [Scenedesmus sp. NREL 46B-D3]
MGRPVPALFPALASRLGFNYCQQLQSQHVVVAAWALARLGHHDAALTARLLWRAVVVRQALQPRGVGLLLWAAGTLRHDADPRAVAQLLQAFKQHAGKARGKDLSLVVYGLHKLRLLQQHRSWLLGGLLQLVMQRLQDMQPAGIATLLSALLELSRSDATAAAAPEQQQAAPATTRLPVPSSRAKGLDPPASLLAKRRQQPGTASPAAAAGAAAAAVSGAPAPHAASSPGTTTSRLLNPRHMAPLYREVARRIAAQLQHTKPQTLASISLALAALGYYDARLFTRLAAALAAAVAAEPGRASDEQAGRHWNAAAGHHGRQQQQGEESQLPYPTQQRVRLLCMFAHFQHPAPALWRALLPQLAAQHAEAAGSCSSSGSLQPRAVVQLLAAGTSAGCASDAVVLQGMLQLALAVLQERQESLQVADLVQLASRHLAAECGAAADASWCCGTAAAAGAAGQAPAPPAACAGAAVLSQPQLLPPQHLPKLLEAAVQLHSSSSSSSSSSVRSSCTLTATNPPGSSATMHSPAAGIPASSSITSITARSMLVRSLVNASWSGCQILL